VKNREVARIFFEIAELLEMKEVQFKPRAYRRAAQTIESLPVAIEEVYGEGKLEELPGVGSSIAKKIEEIIKTGRLEYYEELKREFPTSVLSLASVPGIGPKRAKILYEGLGVENLDDLEKAASEHRISTLEGFGEKLEREILEAVALAKKKKERELLGFVLPIAEDIQRRLQSLKEVKTVELAGSVRRRRETVGDVDILAVSTSPQKVMDLFANMEMVKEVVSKGDTKSSVRLDIGLSADLRVVEEESFGSALQYFTGSKEHSIKIRKIAIKKRLKLNEYGVFTKAGKKIAGETEDGVYRALGLPFIDPELREDRGEVEAALIGELPNLVTLSDIKGDFHVHSKWSEGTASIEELAEYGKKRGYEYLCITDHTGTLRIAHGLSEKRILEQIEEIERVNNHIEHFHVFSGAEVNLMADGTLDISDNILKQLDFVIASIHTGFKMKTEAMTKRLIRAIENENVDIIGHPTGRIINEREAYDFDFDEVFDAARKKGTCFEINAFPDRLDLNDVNARTAKERGLKLAIGTDAHRPDHMRFMEFGVAVARRGWLEKRDLLNTLSSKELLGTIKK